MHCCLLPCNWVVLCVQACPATADLSSQSFLAGILVFLHLDLLSHRCISRHRCRGCDTLHTTCSSQIESPAHLSDVFTEAHHHHGILLLHSFIFTFFSLHAPPSHAVGAEAVCMKGTKYISWRGGDSLAERLLSCSGGSTPS